MLYIKSNLKYNYYMLKINSVISGGIGDEIGLKPDDIILKFDNYNADILDYIYYDTCENFTITVKSQNKITQIDIEKYSEEKLGLEFDNSAEIKPLHCQNKCIFCFVDQLPNNMRNTLYVKDDDYRLSFVTGNYITLTNVTDNDIKRICDRKFSPLYISVHSTNEKLRCKMLSNNKAGNILSVIEKFSKAGIIMHCQVVLCPDVNDKEELEKTIKDLYAFYPNVKSLAVVPVGLTKYREKLENLRPVAKNDAINAINICKNYKDFAYCSDEMYLKAGIDLPSFSSYGDFEQIENGVGLLKKFEKEFYDYLENEIVLPKKRDVLVITGESAFNFINKLIYDYSKKYNVDFFKTIKIENSFFGNSVTVSGLVTGIDILNRIKDISEGKEIIIPKCMLKEFDKVFLDGMNILDLEKKLKADLKVCDMYGYSFFDALTGEL